MSGAHVTGERPLRPPRRRGTTRAAKQARITRLSAADDRAADRLAITRYLVTRLPDVGVRNLVPLLRHAVTCGDLTLRVLTIPGKSTLHAWRTRALARLAAGTSFSVVDFMEADRCGRTPLPLHPLVQTVLEESLQLQPDAALPTLLADLRAFARESRLPLPSEAQVRTAREALSPLAASAAKHGRRAGVIDGGKKLTIPAEQPHDVWSLDEAMVPIWTKAFHPITNRLVSVKRWAFFILDHFSRACVGYHVFSAFRDVQGTAGFTSDEVVGAFLGSTLTPIAPSATAEFAGSLPRVVRMDNHAAHGDLRQLLLAHDVEVPRLPVAMPHARGMIERFMRTMKSLAKTRFGYEGQYLPTDRVREHPKAARSVAAGTLSRIARRTIVEVNELPSGADLGVMVGEIVREYNTRVHAMLQETPRQHYFDHYTPGHARSGLDTLLWLRQKHLRVQAHGIEHDRRLFATEDGHGRHLAIGGHVDVRVEPLNRALFVRIGGVPTALMPLTEVARDVHPGVFAAERAAEAAEASDEAEELRKVVLDRQVGPDASRRADAALTRTLAERADRKASQHEREARKLRKRASKLKAGFASPMSGRELGATATIDAPTDAPTDAPIDAPGAESPDVDVSERVAADGTAHDGTAPHQPARGRAFREGASPDRAPVSSKSIARARETQRSARAPREQAPARRGQGVDAPAPDPSPSAPTPAASEDVAAIGRRRRSRASLAMCSGEQSDATPPWPTADVDPAGGRT